MAFIGVSMALFLIEIFLLVFLFAFNYVTVGILFVQQTIYYMAICIISLYLYLYFSQPISLFSSLPSTPFCLIQAL